MDFWSPADPLKWLSLVGLLRWFDPSRWWNLIYPSGWQSSGSFEVVEAFEVVESFKVAESCLGRTGSIEVSLGVKLGALDLAAIHE